MGFCMEQEAEFRPSREPTSTRFDAWVPIGCSKMQRAGWRSAALNGLVPRGSRAMTRDYIIALFARLHDAFVQRDY